MPATPHPAQPLPTHRAKPGLGEGGHGCLVLESQSVKFRERRGWGGVAAERSSSP